MKKIIFIILKIIEISLLPIIYCLLTYIGWIVIFIMDFFINRNSDIYPHSFGFDLFLIGLSGSILTFGIIMFLIYVLPDLFYDWVESNLKWSENILNWFKNLKL